MNIESINNELKSYINEAEFNGRKSRNTLIKLINKHFYVKLPIENYKYIDIQIMDSGNVTMKDVEYKTEVPINSIEDVYERYNSFKSDAIAHLKKHQVNFNSKANKSNIINILISLLLTIILILVLIYAIKTLLRGNIMGFIWLIVVITSYGFIPSLKERYIQAFNFIKRKLK